MGPDVCRQPRGVGGEGEILWFVHVRFDFLLAAMNAFAAVVTELVMVMVVVFSPFALARRPLAVGTRRGLGPGLAC